MQRRDQLGLAGDRAACARHYLGVDIDDLDDHHDLDDCSHDDEHEHDDDHHHQHHDDKHVHHDEQHDHQHQHEQLDFDLDDDHAAARWPLRLQSRGSGALDIGGSPAVGHPVAGGAR